MIPQICSFFDEQGFVVDDWHELSLVYALQADEFVVLKADDQAYAPLYKVARIDHTIHVDLDDERTQILDVIISAMDFVNVDVVTRGASISGITLVDHYGMTVKGQTDLLLPHCPRTKETVSHAADGIKSVNQFGVRKVTHIIGRYDGSIVQKVRVTVEPIGEARSSVP